MCRHCIAVLLEYHRWAQPRQSRKPNAARETAAQPHGDQTAAAGRSTTAPPSTPDVKLSEIMQFVEWLEPAMNAIENGAPVPESPKLGPGEVSTWIQTIRTLEDRRREGEEARGRLEAEMRDREAYVGRLTQQLQASIVEAKTAQATSQELQREVGLSKGLLAKVAELAGEIARYDGQMRSVASEILNKSAQLDTLTGSFKDLADALKSAAKQIPSK